jgi:hypothetical protein
MLVVGKTEGHRRHPSRVPWMARRASPQHQQNFSTPLPWGLGLGTGVNSTMFKTKFRVPLNQDNAMGSDRSHISTHLTAIKRIQRLPSQNAFHYGTIQTARPSGPFRTLVVTRPIRNSRVCDMSLLPMTMVPYSPSRAVRKYRQ